MCHMCSCVKSLIETTASEDLFEYAEHTSSAAKVEISDLSNETSGTSFVELLRKKFRLEIPLRSFQSLPLLRCRQL